MGLVCTNCGSSEIEFDSAQGNSVCTSCGTVLEENTIVSEITFLETATGASVLQGQFVSDKGVAAPSLFGFQRRWHSSDSREWTLANAKMKIASLANAVQLSDHHVESAHRWFVLSLQHNFTRGRKSQNVAASCLYIVCRQEKTSHMLLDFSDVLQTNVYELGNVFLKMCRLLNLDLPLIDPSLYIGRFASKLEFGDKTQLVANTALRLVSRMKRDWIQTGRRPSGICGACLLISARLYGFRRTQKEIIHVVRICDMTLRKRLNEFAETPSSQLTPEEFHGIWLEQEADPPAFTKNKVAAAALAVKEQHQQGRRHSTSTSAEPVLTELTSTEMYIDPSLFEETELGDLEEMDSDKEVLGAFLEENEIETKTRMWMECNRDYLEAQEEKARLLREQEEQGIVKPTPKKRKKRETKALAEPPATAGEATKQLLQTKKFSKKFNYDALDSLLESQPIQSLADYIEKSAIKKPEKKT